MTAPAPERTDPWLEGGVGLFVFHRTLGYSGDQSNNLPTYVLAAGSAPAIDAAIFPGGLISRGFVGNIGVSGRYEQALFLVSASQNGSVKYPTTGNAFDLGLHVRIPVDPFRFGVRLGYGWRSFVINDASATEPKPPVPSVNFAGLFGQLSARWKLSSGSPGFALDLEGGYHKLLSTGEIGTATYFPRASGSGIDALAGVSATLRPVEIQLAFVLEHYFLSLNSQPGDTYIASGATDDYLGGRLTVSFGLY